MHCRMLGSFPSLHPLDARNIPLSPTKNVSRPCLMSPWGPESASGLSWAAAQVVLREWWGRGDARTIVIILSLCCGMDGQDSLRGLGALRVTLPTQTGAGLGRVGVLLGVPQLQGTLASTKFEEFMLALPSWQDLGASWWSRGLGS